MRFPWKPLARGRRHLNRGDMSRLCSFLWVSGSISLSPLYAPPSALPWAALGSISGAPRTLGLKIEQMVVTMALRAAALGWGCCWVGCLAASQNLKYHVFCRKSAVLSGDSSFPYCALGKSQIENQRPKSPPWSSSYWAEMERPSGS